MDPLTNLLPTDVLKNCIFDSIKNVYSLIKSYKGNLKLLQDNREKLRAIKDDIDRKVEHVVLEEVTNEARLWLESVGLLLDDEQVEDLVNVDKIRAKDQCCFRLIPCNLYQRYEMSQAAKSKADEMQDKLTQRPQDPVTLPKRVIDLDPIPTQHCKGLDSRAMLEQRILKLLKDDEVDAVGLCGMGGVGKTTMAENIKNKGAKDMFDAIFMVEISQVVNIERIQDHIAASIGLSLDGKESLKQRATKLYNALKQVKPKRSENDQQTKILIIMDNIWTYLELDEVGIPREKTPQFCCKILFTSRERKVCKSMGVHYKNIVDVSMLSEHESRSLFWKHIRNTNDRKVDKSLENRLLSSCEGLPLAIVTLSKLLCGEDVSFWQHLADELEKPISCRSDDVHHGAYKILEASYTFIGNNEKKMFFLLACLYPFGSKIPIRDLMQYGIGLNLFRHANSLTEVIWKANRWTDELISSSLLLEDDDNYEGRKVKIHDVVRSCTILCAEEDGHMLMVEAIPQWQADESWEKYRAISLTNDSDTSRLIGMQFDMLETLLWKPSRGSKLDDHLFSRMVKLKILVLPLLGSLPKSILNLTHLRTLHLEDCYLRYEDIELICELVGLVVLSLRRSKFERLPDRMKKLSNLRLLDLNECTSLTTIPANVLSSLTQLEGLYMLKSYGSNWLDNNSEIEQGATASITELRSLCRLKVLEIEVKRIEQITADMMEFITNKHKSIFYANKSEKSMKFSSDNFEVEIGYSLEWLWRYPCLKILLPKSNRIKISCVSDDEGLKNLVPDLDREGFQMLEDLEVDGLEGLKRICDGQVPPQMFCNLRHLELHFLSNLVSHVLPIDVAPNLTTLFVYFCQELKFIWMEHDAPSTQEGLLIYELRCLKVLTLSCLPNLLNALGNDDKVEYSTSEALFNTNKIRFPSLEELTIGFIMHEKVWEWDIHPRGEIGARASPHFCPFPNLRKLTINFCNGMKSGIGSPSIAATLVHLETLQIKFCKKMKQVISEETEDETEISSDNILTFPKLHFLELTNLEELECIYGGSYKVEFPALKQMLLLDNLCMTRFVGPVNTSGFLPQKVEFPCLEILVLSGLKWKHAFSKNFDLTQLNHLEQLDINWSENMEAVVEEIDDGAITPSSSTLNLQFPRLRLITFRYCKNMRWFYSGRHANIVLHFPSLQAVYIVGCDNMEMFSNGPIEAPKLVMVEVKREMLDKLSTWGMDEGDDINNFVSGIYKSLISKGAESVSSSSATLQE